MIGIDFGHAFGSATQFLPIPELIPFRLTRQLTNFLLPLDADGLLKHNMVHTMSGTYLSLPSSSLTLAGSCLTNTVTILSSRGEQGHAAERHGRVHQGAPHGLGEARSTTCKGTKCTTIHHCHHHSNQRTDVVRS